MSAQLPVDRYGPTGEVHRLTLADFVCVRYRLLLEATSPLRLSSFAGSTLRGGFGHVFKRSVCVWTVGDFSRFEIGK